MRCSGAPIHHLVVSCGHGAFDVPCSLYESLGRHDVAASVLLHEAGRGVVFACIVGASRNDAHHKCTKSSTLGACRSLAGDLPLLALPTCGNKLSSVVAGVVAKVARRAMPGYMRRRTTLLARLTRRITLLMLITLSTHHARNELGTPQTHTIHNSRKTHVAHNGVIFTLHSTLTICLMLSIYIITIIGMILSPPMKR